MAALPHPTVSHRAQENRIGCQKRRGKPRISLKSTAVFGALPGTMMDEDDHVQGVGLSNTGTRVISKQLGQWAPLSIPELSQILATARFPWWVAGGHAIDLASGPTRTSMSKSFATTNTGLKTARQRRMGSACRRGGRLRLWRRGERLTKRANSVWCR
jgi:hypothetical protein